MSVDDVTPAAGTDFRCIYNNRIIELTGVSGKNGRVGALEARVKSIKLDIEGIKAVQLKLIIWVSIAAGTSSAAATTILEILS